MDTATLASLISILTPFITGIIKSLIPDESKEAVKKFVPVVPPLVGAGLGLAGQSLGFHVSPDLNTAFVGLFSGAMGSTAYDTVKAVKK